MSIYGAAALDRKALEYERGREEREREPLPLCSTVSTNTSDSLYLLLRNVTADDSGAFECVANNGVGDEAKNTSFLLVRGTVQCISPII